MGLQHSLVLIWLPPSCFRSSTFFRRSNSMTRSGFFGWLHDCYITVCLLLLIVMLVLVINFWQVCDNWRTCPASHTCCCTFPIGKMCLGWGCCSLDSATCCDDHYHCCPHEYPVCNLTVGKCLKVSDFLLTISYMLEKICIACIIFQEKSCNSASCVYSFADVLLCPC
jgi:hypothetical protein